MNIFRLGITFFIAFILATFLFFLDFPFWVVIVTIFLFFLVFIILPQIFTTYRSNNLKSIEKFLEANKKNPLFAYALAMAKGNRVEVEESLRSILAKYKQPYMQTVYQTLLALHLDDIDTADTHAQKIEREPLKSYYAAYIAAKKGNFEEAADHEKNIRAAWMHHALHALYAQEKGQHAEFEIASQKAIAESRGVQKYILVHAFKTIK